MPVFLDESQAQILPHSDKPAESQLPNEKSEWDTIAGAELDSRPDLLSAGVLLQNDEALAIRTCNGINLKTAIEIATETQREQ